MLRLAIDRLQPFLKPATAFTAELAAGVMAGREGDIKRAVIILHEEEGYESINPVMDRNYVTARALDLLHEEERLRSVTLRTLAAVSDRLSKMKGQRLLAFVSNGFTHYDQGGSRDRLPLERVWGAPRAAAASSTRSTASGSTTSRTP